VSIYRYVNLLEAYEVIKIKQGILVEEEERE
jgi:hypothetical protein